uniref:Transposase n=1 Tax=Chenopodium quinoa TaxID=63459 RepID=A0A803N6A6_CHEQI
MKVKKTIDVRQHLLLASASRSGSPTMTIGKFKFNQQVSRNELVNMILMHEYPLSVVEHEGFRRYSHSLNPEFHIISRNTVKSDILKDYKEEKSRLMKLLGANESKVAITTDMWT